MGKGIKLTVPSYIVLGMVKAIGEASPYDMKRLARLSLDHFWSVRHAQLYTEPERLADAGYLSMHREASGRRRKLYSLTDAGSSAFETWTNEPVATLSELRDQDLLKIFFGADPVVTAEARMALHETRLAEFEQTMAEFGDHITEGQRLILRMGMRGERFWLQMWGDVAAGALDGTLDDGN